MKTANGQILLLLRLILNTLMSLMFKFWLSKNYNMGSKVRLMRKCRCIRVNPHGQAFPGGPANGATPAQPRFYDHKSLKCWWNKFGLGPLNLRHCLRGNLVYTSGYSGVYCIRLRSNIYSTTWHLSGFC